MFIGILFALAAGLMWGLVFIGPQLLPDYPAPLLAFGRYLAYGLIVIPLAWFDRQALKELTRRDWLEAIKLSAIGSMLYYLCLSAALQRAGGPLPTMIIGTLPVTIAISANLRDAKRDGSLPWRQLLVPLLLIAAGIACVNETEWQALKADATADYARYISGGILAMIAAACWTWYPLRNADWLRNHAGRSARVWSTAQGLAMLPQAAIGYGLFWVYAEHTQMDFTMPFGPRPTLFIGLMLAIGLFASWAGTLCWNETAKRLPSVIAGQLIVFETLSALAYTFMLRGAWPAPLTLLGIILLIAGVIAAARVQPKPLAREP